MPTLGYSAVFISLVCLLSLFDSLPSGAVHGELLPIWARLFGGAARGEPGAVPTMARFFETGSLIGEVT